MISLLGKLHATRSRFTTTRNRCRTVPSLCGIAAVSALLGLGCGEDSVTPTPTPTRTLVFNLDFRGTFTGLPDSYQAASGLTGRWIDIPPGTTNALINALGVTTTVSITLTGRGDTFNPQTTIDSILLRDSVVNNTLSFPSVAFSVTMTGLQDGQYDVYYYFHGATSGMSMNSTAMTDLSGGSADALGLQGTNWNVMTGVTVIGGTLTITDADGGMDGLSGIQLVRKA